MGYRGRKENRDKPHAITMGRVQATGVGDKHTRNVETKEPETHNDGVRREHDGRSFDGHDYGE